MRRVVAPFPSGFLGSNPSAGTNLNNNEMNMMNIFAIEGHKVICYTLDAGYETDKKRAKKYLQVGKLYTVEKTKVDNWSTDVY